MSVRLLSRTEVRVDDAVVDQAVVDPASVDHAVTAPTPQTETRDRPDDLTVVLGRRRRRWLRPLAIYVASRLLVLVSVLPGAFLHFTRKQEPWPVEPAPSGLWHALGRWDAAWYLRIAHRGYPGAGLLRHRLADVAFFPLHPLLVRAATDVTRLPPLVAGTLVVGVLGAIASMLVWALAGRLAGPAVADRAVLVFCFFPGTFSLSFIYAEALTVVGLAACLIALLDRRWLLAGLAAAVATASRPNAAVILVACGWAAFMALRTERDWRSLAAPVGAMAGVGSYFAYLAIHSGDFGAWFRSERVSWHDHVNPTAVVHYFGDLFHHLPSLQSTRLDPLIVVAGLALVVASLLYLRRAEWPMSIKLYTAAALLLPLTSVAVGPRPRILMAAFPLAILAATRLRGRLFVAVLLVSGVTLGLLSYLAATSLAVTP